MGMTSVDPVTLNFSMKNNFKNIALIFAFLSVGLILGEWWKSSVSMGDNPLVARYDTSRFSAGIRQGEVVEVPLVLQNQGAEPVTITAVNKSCGCLRVADKLHRDLKLPLQVPAGQKASWHVSLNTEDKRGFTVQPVRIDYLAGGLSFSVNADLQLEVCPGPHSITGPILLTPDQLSGKAVIGDAFPVQKVCCKLGHCGVLRAEEAQKLA